MGKCKFEEAIKEMKTFIQERVKGKFVSADTKDVLQAKLDEIAKMELTVRKLQGTVRVTGSKVEVKVEAKQEKGKIDVTDPIATMRAMQEMKLEKEENTKMFMKTAVDVAADQKAFMQDIHDKRVKAVNESLDDIIKKTIKPTIVESSINTLLNYTLDRPVMTMGMYDTTSNRVVLSTLVKEEADNKAREAAVEKYIDLVYGSVDDEQYAVLVNKLKNDKEFMDLIEPSVREVAADIWAKYIKEKGNHAVSHELVHAGAVRYMKNNPDSDLAKRVNELYEAALEHVPRRGDSYWATNVDEFLAEALTNPVTIREMNSVIVEGKTRGLIILKELLDTVLDMLGFKKDSTIYQEVLQSYAGILEQVIGTEAEASLKDIADIAVKELKAKQLLLEGMKDC